jgi:hypothetical protein
MAYLGKNKDVTRELTLTLKAPTGVGELCFKYMLLLYDGSKGFT